MLMVEDAITNPTSATHKEMTTWRDLSPVASECLKPHLNLLPLPEQAEDEPRDSERNQSCKYPGWSTEQEGHSPVIPKCSGEGGEEGVEREGGDDTGDASHNR